MKTIDKDKKIVEEKVIDASGKSLGRLATAVASVLSGKDKATYERHIYCGAPVKVVNASKMRVSVERLEGITHKRYSGFPGGLRLMSGVEVSEKNGFKELVKHAVFKMLPGNKLRREMMKNLKIED